MSSNLLKQGYGFTVSQTEEKRIIDTNELAARRLEELAETRNCQMQGEEGQDDFVQGLEAEDVSALLEDTDGKAQVLKAEPPKVDTAALLEEAKEQARTILDDAKAQAEQLVKEALEQAEISKKAVLDEARMNGYRDGSEKAKAEAESLKQQLKAREKALEAQYQDALEQMEPQLVETITGIYEHVFHVELYAYWEILVHLIASTLRKVDGNKEFLVHVSKEDYPYVNMQKRQLQAGMTGGVSLEIIEDVTMEKNACMIETEGGIFDCGLGTQLEELRKRLMLLSYSGHTYRNESENS